MRRLRVGLVGVGKIAKEQHLPAIADSPAFQLAACASRNARVDGVDNFEDIASMLNKRPDLDCVAICTPPQAHFDGALLALRRGKHVLLEKPPSATTRQLSILVDEARQAKRTLFQSWHSRFAAGVEPAREWLRTRSLSGGRIVWKEDVRVWHPGQKWIWTAGGFGVFDPGINALSILTRIIPGDILVDRATLKFPVNCGAPVAADIDLKTVDGVLLQAEFDFRHAGEAAWTIDLETSGGPLRLSMGGSLLRIGGKDIVTAGQSDEYAAVYRRYAELCATGESDVDAQPFALVADAFLIGERLEVEAFET